MKSPARCASLIVFLGLVFATERSLAGDAGSHPVTPAPFSMTGTAHAWRSELAVKRTPLSHSIRPSRRGDAPRPAALQLETWGAVKDLYRDR